VLVAVSLAILAGYGFQPSAQRRLRTLRPQRPRAGSPKRRRSRARHLTGSSRLLPWLAAAGAGIAVASYIAPPVGLVVGAGVTWVGGRWLSSLPSRDAVARAVRRDADLPLAVDLLAAAMLAGATPAAALAVVATAVGPPVRDDLTPVAQALVTGAELDEAWASAPADLAPVGAAFRRSAESGTPAAEALICAADELRAALRARWRADAGRVGVRSALPLGLCFLPAFVLIGIVPVVAGLVRGVLG